MQLKAKWLCLFELTPPDSELASVQFYTIELRNVHAYNVPIISNCDLDLFLNIIIQLGILWIFYRVYWCHWLYLHAFFLTADVGLFPNILNLATRSTITVNATCGEEKSEVFCKLVDHVKIFPYKNSHCDICDARSQDDGRRHPITNAINGRNSWWQSPTLTNGAVYNYVTITLDLRQVLK